MGIFEDIINGQKPVVESVQEEKHEEEIFTESTYIEDLPYLKVIPRKVFLPKGTPMGRNNLCFLYTNDTKESIAQMNTTVNFIAKNYYHFIITNQCIVESFIIVPIKFERLMNGKYCIKQWQEIQK